MRKRSFAVGLFSGLLLLAASSFGQNNPLITVDEQGNGSLLFPGSPGPVVATGSLLPDPGPGGLTLSLTYNLLGPPSLVAGDVVLLESGLPSDLIRFNPAGTGTAGYPASLVFYSDVEGLGELADTGFPALRYTNLLNLNEGVTNTLYTPLAGQPGFVSGFSVSYSFVSTEAVGTPEPAAASLIFVGSAILIARRRFINKRSAS